MDFLMGILSTIFKVDEQINNKNRNSLNDDNIEILDDIAYSPTERMDIYRDTMIDGPMPVLINVHGGGWMVGDKKWRKGMGTIFAENGFFVINPNYSLSPSDYYPECIRDIYELIEWVSAHSEEYHLDLDRLYITGDSAGAHIAAVVCALQNKPDILKKLKIDEPSLKIKRAALFCGVYQYDKCVDQAGAAGLVKEMTGTDYKHYVLDFPYYRELSSLNYIDDEFPPTYMVSAPLDMFCGGQAELLEERLRGNNVEYKHYIPTDKFATHCFHLNLGRTDSIEAIEGAAAFLKGEILDADLTEDNAEDNAEDTQE